MINNKTTIYTTQQLYSNILEDLSKDLNLYSIQQDSRDHLRLLYHHTIRYILESKRNNPHCYFSLQNLQTSLNKTNHIKYSKFLSKLSNIIPNTLIQETHNDPNFINILINRLQKSTKKNKNLSKLMKFGDKNGLRVILNEYLTDPKFKYALFT